MSISPKQTFDSLNIDLYKGSIKDAIDLAKQFKANYPDDSVNNMFNWFKSNYSDHMFYTTVGLQTILGFMLQRSKELTKLPTPLEDSKLKDLIDNIILPF